MLEVLEVEEAVQVAQRQEVEEIPRPISAARCNTLGTLRARGGWDALGSDEAVNEQKPVPRGQRRKRVSISLPKRFKHRGIPLKKLKRLTAIIESPRSKTANSPVPAFQESMQSHAGAEKVATPDTSGKAYTLRKVDEEDMFICPESPKPEVLPSFAIHSPGRYGAGIANHDNPKALRSKSLGALSMPVPDKAMLGQMPGMRGAKMHARSISFMGSTESTTVRSNAPNTGDCAACHRK